MKLYYVPQSGHAHRAHLFLSLLGIEHELIHVDLSKQEHKTPDFLAMNRFGQVPVLDDDGVIVADSTAILVYLARKYQRTDWLPDTLVEATQVQRWLSVASGQLMYGACAARLINLLGAPFNPDEVIPRAHALLKILEAELTARDWLVAGRPTIADVALYSYIARAPEGNVDIAPYPAVNAWLA
ncbi:MAG: glutathione S-transferase, partial [Burkholderiaceae bacterium]|nr:glutathione S-transferase [Burkholderiaceae bacterium]